MKEKLELKHLAPYLPYRLKMVTTKGQGIITGSTLYRMDTLDLKPILRPLSDLTNEIEHNGERFVPVIELGIITIDDIDHFNYKAFKHRYENYWISEFLFKWHFDCFDLIKKGLAVDINTLK